MSLGRSERVGTGSGAVAGARGGAPHVTGLVLTGVGAAVHATGAPLLVALPILMLALGLAVGLGLGRRIAPVGSVHGGLAQAAAVAQLAISATYLARVAPDAGAAVSTIGGGLLAAQAVTGLTLLRRPRADGGVFVAFCGAHAVLAVVWVMVTVPPIDVWVYQELAAERLLDGVNPYAPGYPDIYAEDLSARFFAPGLSVDGVLQFGFPYPPISLLASTGGALLTDVRFAHVAASIGSAFLLRALGNGRPEGVTAAVLLLSSPLVLLVITFAWTEMFVLLALLLWLSQQPSGPMRGGSLGLLVGVKQYAVLTLGTLWSRPIVADGRDRIRQVGIATATVVVTAAPFVAWGPDDFFASTIALHLDQPFRPDSLSLVAAVPDVGRAWAGMSGTAVSVAVTLVALVALRRRSPANVSARSAASAAVVFVFVLTSKQAFANYYLIPMGLLAASLATRGATADGDPGATLT